MSVAYESKAELAFFKTAVTLLTQPDAWAGLFPQHLNMKSRSTRFRNVTRAVAALVAYVFRARRSTLYEQFGALVDPEVYDLIEAKPLCLWVSFLIDTEQISRPHGGLRSHLAQAHTSAVAVQLRNCTTRIEVRHGHWQRDAQFHSYHNLPVQFRHVSALHIFRRSRAIECQHWLFSRN